MCDAWVALPDATSGRHVLFGKNSDRPSFDCQPLVRQPRQTSSADEVLHLEYLDIPQVETRYATLGSSPYWCWGYEQGVNEQGVVIGNEAIFTKTFRDAARAYRQGRAAELGLLGMDLVRLGLERARSARQAVETMGTLIERHGQFGSGVPARDHAEGGYDNAFLVADPHEAWVLEAVGRRWVARRFERGVTSISNEPSIRHHWDLGSSDIERYAHDRGWWPDAQPFDFARAYIDDLVPRQVSHLRAMRSRQLLGERQGQITPAWMMRIARDHYEDTFLQGPYFDAADPDFHSLCMHDSAADFTWGNTAGSCVAVLPPDRSDLAVFWWTPGPPCNGCYVPFFVHGHELPASATRAGTAGKTVTSPAEVGEDSFAPDSYWWLFKRLMDVTKGDTAENPAGCYPQRNHQVRARFDALEQRFATELPRRLQEAIRLRRTDEEAAARLLDDFSADCVRRVTADLEELLASFS